MLRGLTLDQSSSNTVHLSGTGHRLSWPVIASAKHRSPTESKSGAGFQARNADILVGASGRAPPLRITPLQILRSARRFCRNPSPGGASDRSPVREHWERRERQASPGTGRKNWSRVLLSPRAGAGKFAIRTQGSRAGLFSCALRASQTFYWLRLCRSVLHHCQFFAARDDFGAARVRRTKENSPARQRWEWVKDTGSPGTGRKSFYSGASFAPFRGWSIGYGNPRLTPWAMLFRPPGLVLWLRLCRSVRRPILAAAGFSRLFRPWHANLQFSSLNGLLHFAASDHRPIARPC